MPSIFSGIAPDGAGNPVSIVGDFIPNNTGSFAGGSFWDVNEAGTLITKAAISGGSYATDPNNPGTGRGTAKIGGLDFVYYVIDNQDVVLMGIDLDATAPGTYHWRSFRAAGRHADANQFVQQQQLCFRRGRF